MGFFTFKKPVQGSYLDFRNPPYRRENESLGRVKTVTAGGQYDHNRNNSVTDRLEEGSVLEDWIPRQTQNLHLLMRRIYLRDWIAGTVVDIFSTLPWGKNWELTGIRDAKVLQMYQDMIETLGIWGELPMISREYQIIGRQIASLNFNERTGFWDGFVPIDPDQAKITTVPTSNVKPLIDVLASPAWREFSRSIDPRIVEIKERLPKPLLEMLQSQGGYIPLDPLNTLFLARRVNQYDQIGTSIYTRILPAWAYEMALWNASLTGARRRNRSILVLTAGIEDSWEPNDAELSALTSMFMQADEDPTGAIVAVRQGVEASEIRDPAAIWGISQEFEFLSTLKMRALGVSEAYLSGDANVSNMETARTALGKQVTAFKDNILREIFEKQLFPTFARIHNFQIRSQAQVANRYYVKSSLDQMKEYDRRMYESERLTRFGYPMITAKQALELPYESLLMPGLITEDTLRPEQDAGYLDMMSTLAEKGVPVPLRIWASAAGYDFDKALSMMEEDIVLKKRLAQLGSQGASDDGGGGMSDFGGEDSGGDLGEMPEETAEESGRGKQPNMLPPKWGSQAAMDASRWGGMSAPSRQGQSQALSSAENMLRNLRDKRNPLVRGIARNMAPGIIDELAVPPGRELVPYTDPQSRELKAIK